MRLIYSISPDFKKLGINQLVVAEIYNVQVAKQDETLETLKQKTVSELLQLTESDLASNNVLQGYKHLVAKVGRSIKKFPPSAESLINIVQRNHRFPHINTAVDAYNIVAAQSYLALGVHDMDKLHQGIEFKICSSPQEFVPVGSDSKKSTQIGDYIYTDTKQVLAWLDSKDSDNVKISVDTKNILVVIQGNPATTIEYTNEAIIKACELITQFCGGTYETQIIS